MEIIQKTPYLKLYISNFINISSSYNLLDAIYPEISGTMKSIHSLGWKKFLSV